MASVLWFRRDLRVRDLPALLAAHEAGPVLPLFVADPALLATAGPVRRAALRIALEALERATDGALVVRTGRPADVVPAVVAEVGAGSVHVSGETTPYGRRRDAGVRDALDVPLVATGTPYAVGPGTLLTGGGTPFKVFTPFSRAWREHGHPAPAPLPDGPRWASAPSEGPAAVDPAPPSADPGGARPSDVSEDGARERWREFLEEGVADYDDARDRPDLRGTSELSVHLKYGTLHPRTLLAELAAHPAAGSPGAERFVSELAWREFYADVLWHRPDSAWTDLRALPMAYDDPEDPATAELVDAWRAGRTGYPFVDAGMRQLLAEGWMHNRLRMVTASFLVKDLHVWWPVGARHFLAHLRDGDLASNNHGWQWVAGTGTDAAPYFRVFNPVSQGERFDPAGDYVRRWVPELRHVPGRAVHQPWTAPGAYDAGYPGRVVDHAEERREALARYDAARG